MGHSNRLPLSLMAAVLWLPIAARADQVSGRVYDEAGRPQPNLTVRVHDKDRDGKVIVMTTFTTDAEGRFSVYLPPGVYTVEAGGGTAAIQGLPQPTNQDIRLARK